MHTKAVTKAARKLEKLQSNDRPKIRTQFANGPEWDRKVLRQAARLTRRKAVAK